MRRPGTIDIETYISALDLQLRDEVTRVRRRPLPHVILRLWSTLKSKLQPILQSGAIVLTSVAVIVAVGAAPASMRTPSSSNTPLVIPSEPLVAIADQSRMQDRLPPDEFLAVGDESASVQLADNPDISPMEKE
jgi:hypothetical protein